MNSGATISNSGVRKPRRLPSLLTASVFKMTLAAIAVALCLVPAEHSYAQRRKNLQGSTTEFRPRMPNDQIEGTVWEYHSTKYHFRLEDGEQARQLEGRFRVEGNAIFLDKQVVSTASREQRVAQLKRLAQGGGEVAIPNGPEEKRIGEYRKIDGAKYRFEFHDDEGLHGILIAWPKEGSPGVWLANYYEKDGNQTTGKWSMELRGIED